MALPLDLALLAGGLVLLTAGAEGVVRGGSRLAAALGVSPLVVGLTVVAFGTSSPEFVVSLVAAARGAPDVALGNVVGSNIVNLLVIAGIGAVILPLTVHADVIRRELPILLGVSLATLLLSVDGLLGRIDGLLLVAGLVAYLLVTYFLARHESAAGRAVYEAEVPPRPQRPMLLNVAMLVGGLALLAFGGHVLVQAALRIARDAGISERLVGLTLVAIGTSLPELATTLIAVYRRHTDIAVGNVVGSCIFNLLGILGAAALIAPIRVPWPALSVDMTLMTVATLAFLPLARSRGRLGRWEGSGLVVVYVLYVLFLVYGGTGE